MLPADAGALKDELVRVAALVDRRDRQLTWSRSDPIRLRSHRCHCSRRRPCPSGSPAMLMASYGVENCWKRPSMSANAPAPPPATQSRPPSSALAPITLPGCAVCAGVHLPARAVVDLDQLGLVRRRRRSRIGRSRVGRARVRPGVRHRNARVGAYLQRTRLASSAGRGGGGEERDETAHISSPVDGDGAVLESDQDLTRRGRRKLDVEHRAGPQRPEDVDEVFHRAVLWMREMPPANL